MGGVKAYSLGATPEDVIQQALAGERYPMTLAGEDIQPVVNAVNQGIDSHLQALTDSTFTWTGRKLACDVAPADMLVLLRRLYEDGSEAAWSLRSAILSTIGIEEV